MKVYFWGTRGSLPTSHAAHEIRDKVRAALLAARGRNLESDDDLDRFIDELPFAVAGDYGGNTTCYEIQDDDLSQEYVLFDAGSGIHEFSKRYMAAGKEGEKAIFHIFISHVHWDHVQGFPFFAPAFIPGNRIVFHGHHASLPDVLRYQMEPPFFPIPIDAMEADLEFDIRPPGTAFSAAGFEISTIEQQHPGIAYGYRFEKNGKAIVFSTDSEHQEGTSQENYPFVEFFKDADLVAFDAQYSYAEACILKKDWGHSSNVVGVDLCQRARVKNLCMVHHDPEATDEWLDTFLKDSLTYRDIQNHDGPDRFPTKIYMASDSLCVEL
tara:strand:- start:10015 stop:10989 length:975 start_codon:yes stop_codon:yes gene_type:complete